VAAPSPWGENQKTGFVVLFTFYTAKYRCKKKIDRINIVRSRRPPVFPLTFCKKLVEKFPCPSPSPGVHHVWNLSRPPQALPPKKFWAPPHLPRGRYGGSNFQIPPLPPQIPLVKGRSSSVHGPGSTPATIPEILVNVPARQPEILSISYWPPAPGYV